MFARQRRKNLSRRISNSSIKSAYEKLLSIDFRTNALYDEYLRLNAQNWIMKDSDDLNDALEKLRKFEIFRAF